MRFDYSVNGLFSDIDDWSYKYIDTKNMKRFLMKTSVYPEEALLKAIIRRLDTDGDARLSFEEFAQALKPMKDNSNIAAQKSSVFKNNAR